MHGHPTETLPTFCLVCTKPIDADRAKRKSNTCSAEHAKLLINERRKRVQQKKCRHCGVPSTPEDRAGWLEWRKANPAERKHRSPRAATMAQG